MSDEDRNFSGAFVLLLLLLLGIVQFVWQKNKLPEEVVRVLSTAPSVTLYSLGSPNDGHDLPEWDFHGHHVLEKIALHQDKAKQTIKEFESLHVPLDAYLPLETLCLCRPRHGLRVNSKQHTYDLELCYQCGHLRVFRDGQEIASLRVQGSPEILNGILGSPANDSYAEEGKLAMKEAAQGDAVAQRVLGSWYLNGWEDMDVTQDWREALKWYSKAAAQGDAEAQWNLGDLYANGFGVKQDYQEAIKWYHKSADQGDSVAYNRLTTAYEKGEGVKQDYAEAYFWSLIEIIYGHEKSTYFRDELAKHLTSAQLKAQNIRASEWRPTPAPEKTPE